MSTSPDDPLANETSTTFWLPPDKLTVAVASDLEAGALVALPPRGKAAAMTLGIVIRTQDAKYIYLLTPPPFGNLAPGHTLNVSQSPFDVFAVDLQFAIEVDLLANATTTATDDLGPRQVVVGQDGVGLTAMIATPHGYPDPWPFDIKTWRPMDKSKIARVLYGWRVRFCPPGEKPFFIRVQAAGDKPR